MALAMCQALPASAFEEDQFLVDPLSLGIQEAARKFGVAPEALADLLTDVNPLVMSGVALDIAVHRVLDGRRQLFEEILAGETPRDRQGL